jgi:energy-coupling factor transporter transmembrane protein EcfT
MPTIVKLLVTITFSSIPAIFDEAEHITRVQKTRGAKKTVLSLIIPLFHLMFQRAEHLAIVILTRGFSL